jgi:hypothetical protein
MVKKPTEIQAAVPRLDDLVKFHKILITLIKTVGTDVETDKEKTGKMCKSAEKTVQFFRVIFLASFPLLFISFHSSSYQGQR